jgi:preflagellin peptidase FlaK
VNEILDGARVIVCLIFLVYASWSDYKTREVSNKVWGILGPIAVALTAFQILVYSTQPIQMITTYFLSFAITSGLSLAVFYFGGFGGADAKAFICIALAFPIYPGHLFSQPIGFISPLFPITIFTNSVLLGALSVFYTLFRNLLWIAKNTEDLFEGLKTEPLEHKILAAISGYKVKISKLETEHMFPLEDVETSEDGEKKRKLLAFPKYEERENIITRLKENIKEEQHNVWVTPGLPLLIFITIGFIIALLYGDIIWSLLGSVIV